MIRTYVHTRDPSAAVKYGIACADPVTNAPEFDYITTYLFLLGIFGFNLATIDNYNTGDGYSVESSAHSFNRLDHLHPLLDLAKDDMFAVKPSSLFQGEEKLRAIRVGTRVGHGQQSRSTVFHVPVVPLIFEFGSVDTLSTTTISFREITTLAYIT
jgi:hypothetical protein